MTLYGYGAAGWNSFSSPFRFSSAVTIYLLPQVCFCVRAHVGVYVKSKNDNICVLRLLLCEVCVYIFLCPICVCVSPGRDIIIYIG